MSMHLLQKIVIAVLAFMALATPIGAQSSEDCLNNKDTVQFEVKAIIDLMAWIVARTDWTIQGPPTICHVTNTKLDYMAYGKENSTKHLTINALYAPKTHIVYLSENWNPNDLRDRSLLLHELIHHLQALNNVEAPCLAKNELQAFELQRAWLYEQGIQDPYKFLDTDELTIKLFAQCPD